MPNELNEVKVYSSHGDFTFDRNTGAILEVNLGDGFGPNFPIEVDVKGVAQEDLDAGSIDVLFVPYFYIDVYGRRQYEPPVPHRDTRCPTCEAQFEAGCICWPSVVKSPRGTLYVNREEKTIEESNKIITVLMEEN